MTTGAQQWGRTGVIVVASGLLACASTWLFARLWPGPPVERATLAAVLLVPVWTTFALAGVAAYRRARPGHARRQLFALHRRLGAALTLAAMLVFGSGVGAVLDRALAGWQAVPAAGQARALPGPASDQALDAALATLLREHPELSTGQVTLHPASRSEPWIRAEFLNAQREHLRVDLDPASGEVIARGEPPLWLLRELHRHLLIPPQLGEPVLGLIGLGLGMILLSGLATRRWLRVGPRERVRTPRPRAMLVHQWLGAGLIPAATLWAWSGAMLGLTLVIVPIVGGAAYQGDRAALMRDVLAADRTPLIDEPSEYPDLQAISQRRCAELDAWLPNATVHQLVVRHPGRASAVVRVGLEGPGLLARGSVTLGAAELDIRDCRALPSAGVGMLGFMGSIALHYGEWGEWDGRDDLRIVVDLVYTILGCALVALAWLGGGLLVRRRTREGDLRGAARLQRWLTGVGVGLVVITVELALMSRIPAVARDADSTLALVGLTCVVIAVHVATGDLATRRRQLLISVAVMLAALPVLGWVLGLVQPGAIEGLAWLGAASIVVSHRARAARRHRELRAS
ncbi:putative iron-regulated membrane protein [Enhygromyxa salina]|uniref:Putative iron-regulated membrane protein n=1 Tax=Enhygromyxa salina TaxID=215803 RepID=A0A0C2CXW1_9BACT|nr:putative iron-regulated membrane protein [Enhygromyxa salina]